MSDLFYHPKLRHPTARKAHELMPPKNTHKRERYRNIPFYIPMALNNSYKYKTTKFLASNLPGQGYQQGGKKCSYMCSLSNYRNFSSELLAVEELIANVTAVDELSEGLQSVLLKRPVNTPRPIRTYPCSLYIQQPSQKSSHCAYANTRSTHTNLTTIGLSRYRTAN